MHPAKNEDRILLEKQKLLSRKKKNTPAFPTKTNQKENQSERYENIGKNTDEETEIESFVGIHDYDVERIRQQFTHRVFCFTNHIDHIFITLSLVANLSNILRFPIICSENGGILFLIPYALCLIFIAIPIIYLESAIGQYSSLPSIRLFHHLCPAFGGIGVAMLFVAIFKNILLSYSAMGIFYTFKSVTVLFSSLSRTTWLECVYESHSSCYDPYLKCNEAIGSYQYYSKCYNLQLLSNKTNLYYTWEQIVIAMTSTSEALREFPPNIYWKEKINKPRKISEFLVASATIEQAIIAIIAILGIRLYARIVRFIVILPPVCMVICIIYATAKVGFQNTFALIAEGFSPDMHKFLHLKTWITAALQAMIATNLLDGTYITLASMKNFRNNFMRDTFLIIIYGMIIILFGCIFVFSVSGAAVKLMFPMSIGKGLAMVWKHGENVFFTVLALFFAKTSFGTIILIFIYFSLFLCTISIQILTLEMIIMTVYRTSTRIKFIEPKTSRNIIICIYFLLINLCIYTFGQSYMIAFSDITVRYFYFALLLPILALLELLISIHIYSLKRLMVNLHTMLGGPPNIFWKYLGYPVSWYWTACWYIITPILCMISLPFALFIIIKGEVYSIIIISMIIHIARIYKTGRTIKSLFVADLCWTPELGIYRQQALYEERATRAII
ncbi:Sodium- and chloride-dependent neutral and basic amino acid transporter B(0+) [Dirofilaria immitis]